MDNSLSFLYVVFFVSVILHVFAGILTATFIMPLQAKQAGVKNGLAKLRKQMLFKGFLNLTIIIASIFALTLRFVITDVATLRYMLTTMIALHAIGTTAKAIIDFQIYHQQYSPENKEMHEKIEKMEIAKAKRAIDNPKAKR